MSLPCTNSLTITHAIIFLLGVWWLDEAATPWEWVPNDEALRAAQAPICVSGGGGKGGDAPCGIDESCSAPGSLVRVWLELGGGRRAPQVGRVLKRCPRKGLRVLLADGFVWLQRSHLAEPLRTGEKASAEELAPLLRPLGAPTLAALGAVGAPPATPTATRHAAPSPRASVAESIIKKGLRVELWGREEVFFIPLTRPRFSPYVRAHSSHISPLKFFFWRDVFCSHSDPFLPYVRAHSSHISPLNSFF